MTQERTPESRPALLRLQGAGAYEAPQGRDFPPHQHSSWELAYYRSGKIRCPVGKQVYEVQTGVMLLTPPRTVHAEQALTDYSSYYIAIDAPADYPWPTLCVDDADHSLGGLCGLLVREWNGCAPQREEMLDLLLRQLDILLKRENRQQRLSSAEQVVQRAERLLEERYAGSITIEEVARELGVSSSSLRTHFNRVRGRTPIQHLHSVRVQHASEMLRTSSLTLEAIAGLCGFDSASHLSRHVKRATGKSPGSLRNGLRNGNGRH